MMDQNVKEQVGDLFDALMILLHREGIVLNIDGTSFDPKDSIWILSRPCGAGIDEVVAVDAEACKPR